MRGASLQSPGSAPRQALPLAGLALLLALAAWALESREPLARERWLAAAGASYAELGRTMAAAADEAARSVAEPPSGPAERLATFERLRALAGRKPYAGSTFLLLDPDGDAVAWAGDGLLHEVSAASLPAAGFAYVNSYTAASLLAVTPLGSGRRPWRMVAGKSFPTEDLPFATPDRPAPRKHAWALGAPPVGAGDGLLEVESPGLPPLWVELLGAPSSRLSPAAVLWRGALLATGAALLLLALQPPTPLPRFAALFLAGGGALTWARALDLGWAPASLLAAGAAASFFYLSGGRGPGGRAGGLLGGAAALALVALAWLLQDPAEMIDLGSALRPGLEAQAYRLGFCLLSVGLLLAFLRREGEGESFPRRPRRRRWPAAALLLAAALSHDFFPLAVPLLALGFGLAATAWSRQEIRRRPLAGAALLLALVLGAATAWETAYRERFRQAAADYYLPRLAAPKPDELRDLHTEILAFFDRRPLDDLLPSPPSLYAAQDLAYELWRSSPMAETDGFSALVVEPAAGSPSSFSFGIPLDGDLYPDPSASYDRWQVPVWREARVEGVADLMLQGRPWGQVRYYFLTRPGFRLAVEEKDELERKLLRGGVYLREVDGLPRSLSLVIHGVDGEVELNPWDEAAPELPDLGRRDRGRAETPSGRAWYWVREGADLIEILYLPMLHPPAALERIATHALGALALIGLMLAGALAFPLPRAAFRDTLRSAWRSYSKRLILVYTGLLFAPLVALNLVLLRGFESWMRGEQMEQAEQGAEAAQLFLSDYIQGLPIGFDLQSQLGRELLTWVSEILQHETNLYWRGRLIASSQQELFTSGLLPTRIPGEIYADMVLGRQPVGVRTQHSGELAYLEVYRPLQLETASAEDQLFVSVPLLEQEADAAREISTTQRRAVLFSSGLFLALLAVGGRLARSFTDPIRELVSGTERIAAGASSLEVSPRELELAALAQAIDTMAGKIARGRERLLAEKKVVDRMVANITSGVVSVDHQGRVLMQNRVAAALLGTRVGEVLEASVSGDERLRPVSDFLARAGDRARRASVQLSAGDGEGEDWSLTWVPIPGSRDPAALLVVDDVTEVLRGQRLEAWMEMARIIAHEIKNPLTPIRLSTEHLREVYQRDPARVGEILEHCTDNILRQVEALRQTAGEFSTYSRIPRADLEEGDLREALAEVVGAYRDAEREGVRFRFRAPPEEIRARFDRRLLGRAIRNLLENALRASAGRESRGKVELAVERDLSRPQPTVEIRVRDSGPGVVEAHLPRIFEPYFSTHETGTGLGLAITRRIVEEHEGRISARNLPGGGLEVLISMPASGPAEEPEREEG